VLKATSLFERTVLVRDVPFLPGRTFYAQYGDVFAWGCLAVTLAALVATFVRRPPSLSLPDTSE
jgi:apolipoprotein N-acyltransferase